MNVSYFVQRCKPQTGEIEWLKLNRGIGGRGWRGDWTRNRLLASETRIRVEAEDWAKQYGGSIYP